MHRATLCVAVLAALWLGLLAPAQDGRPCNEPQALMVAAVERSLGLAYSTLKALDASGAKAVVMARAGQDLSKYGTRGRKSTSNPTSGRLKRWPWPWQTTARARCWTGPQAQAWLQQQQQQQQGYQPSPLTIAALTRLGARMTKANVAFDNHPDVKRYADKIETVTVDSVFDWMPRPGW